ncbi:MAG TPA: sigma-70 family RNA polymerase sigma factor [Holophagaceae bacterium]|nr:sigma-70 family RNA polymerase sigma factor [Holophagaceae bacterium]
MELEQLIPLVRRGDELAWEAFVRRFQGRVFGLAHHYTGHPEDARDLAQDVFVKVYRNLHALPEGDGCLPWLLRITRNACLDHLRRRKARPNAGDLPVEELAGLRATEPDPEAAHLEAALKAEVHRALRELTDLNREILLLKEIQGLSVEDVAAILEVPVGTVKSRAHRARLELAEKLAAAGVGG